MKKMEMKKNICLDIIKNDKNKIIQRRICSNNVPYAIDKTEDIYRKGQHNNINTDKIDRLFNYIIDKKWKTY